MVLRALLPMLALAPSLALASDWDPPAPAPAPTPTINVWIDASAGGGASFEGEGLAARTAMSAGLAARHDFMRLRWNYFGERTAKNRHPHADWTSTAGALYGVHWRNRDAIASVAIGLGATNGFARGRLLYEQTGDDAYRWYRPRHFHAASAIGDLFFGAGTRTAAIGITLSFDANPIRQTATAQATFQLGALP